MNYQVLARKWRPQNFAQLVGQEHVVTAISNALDNNRLHHAYLFTGTRGVGKTTIARIFSKSLNCEQGMSSTPCGQCATCLEIDQGHFIDLLEIDAASRTKVEDTRELLDNVQYKPTRGQYKVYLIDEVHMLSKHSFNALLKTLEEPPPHVKFLLATTDPQKLPVTILSRCLQFNLKAMSREQISGQLGYILGEEGLAFEPEALAQLARAANGSMRDALSLTDQAIAQGNGQVSLAVVTDMLGLMDKNQVLKLLKAILEGQNQQVFQQLEQLASQSVDYSQLLAELLSLLHQVALTQMVPEVCKLETIAARAIYHLANSVAAEQIQLLYQIALQGRKDLPYAIDGRSGMEMTLLRMLAFNPQRELSSAQFIADNQPAVAASGDIALSNEIDKASLEDIESPSIEEQQLNQQQEHIWQQTEQLHPQSAPADITPIESEPEQMAPVEQPEQALPSQQTSAENFSGQIESVPLEQPPLAEAQQAHSTLSQTESLLALRRGLRQSKPEAKQPKKPEAVEPAVELNQPEAQPFSQSASATDKIQVPPVETEPELLQTYEANESAESDIPPWALAANQEPAELDEPIQVAPELDMQELLNQVVDIPVTIDIPTFLSDGQKVTHAKQLDSWSDIIEQTGVGGLTKQLALQSSMQKQDNVCQLTLPEALQHLNNETAQMQLQSVLSELWQQPVQLQVEIGEPENTPFAIQQSINNMRQQYAQQVINSDINVQFFQQQFDAQLVENSIEPR